MDRIASTKSSLCLEQLHRQQMLPYYAIRCHQTSSIQTSTHLQPSCQTTYSLHAASFASPPTAPRPLQCSPCQCPACACLHHKRLPMLERPNTNSPLTAETAHLRS